MDPGQRTSADRPFSARAVPRRHLSTTSQVGVALFGLVSAGMFLVNLVWLPFAARPGERLPFVVGGLFALGVSLWVYRWLRRQETYSLVLDQEGIRLSGGVTGQWAWGELTSVAIVRSGESDLLTIEDSRAANADRGMPGLMTTYRTLTKLSPLGVSVPLRDLDAGREALTGAIHAFSGGRFPDPERDSFRPFSRE